jgi:signal transduction histidine kinase
LSNAVLVNVDDNEPARYARSRILRQAGFEVHDAATGADALRLIGQVELDLVLLDVNLPDMSGIEVCRLIKNRDQNNGVIVLQISASATSAPHATEALNVGADSYLVEPVDPDVLVATVRAFLRLRHAERALAAANLALSERNAELKSTNDALMRSNQDLEDFAYIASHDLQEPLRTISTHIELLDRSLTSLSNESDRQVFGFVKEAARRMAQLISDVLAYSRIRREAPPLKPTRLSESVSWALENLADGIVASDGQVTVGPLPLVNGDALQLSQVFQNLIGNSIKYRSKNKPLRIAISADPNEAGDWVVRVQDNGIGIEEEYLEKIFRPFKRLHGYEIPGNGIGLAVCRRIIEGHGGHIRAESRYGEGATFLFTLKPAASEELDPQSAGDRETVTGVL